MIDGKEMDADPDETIVKACARTGVMIPTLCYLEGVSANASCGLCVVEIEGAKSLVRSCVQKPAAGMKIQTSTPRVRRARKIALELLLANHPADCLSCMRGGNCELRSMAELLGVSADRFPKTKKTPLPDYSAAGLVRNNSKCILCGRCVAVCSEVQTVHAIAFAGRGSRTRISTFKDRGLGESVCVQCGQCSVVCPTAAITERDETEAVFRALGNPDLVTIVQTAPAIRASLGEALGMKPGALVTGVMVNALRRLGFSKIFDTQFAADLTIMEEGSELISRLGSGAPLPMITSCSPGWINFIETFYPQLLGHLSSCKSPQQMFGAVAKTWYAQAAGIDPEKMRVVSIMPCTAKKGETKRPGMDSACNFNQSRRVYPDPEAPGAVQERMRMQGAPGFMPPHAGTHDSGKGSYQDVDWALTTRELARMIRTAGIDLAALPEEDFDDPLGKSTGAATIFGTTGGVAEAALRTVYELTTGKTLLSVDFEIVRGMEGIKKAEVDLGGNIVRIAVVHTLKNARIILDEIALGKSPYHFIEVMSCPGGCIGGGGQPVLSLAAQKLARNGALYREDHSLRIRKSHENPAINELYRVFLEKPLSHVSHSLLHTGYAPRRW